MKITRYALALDLVEDADLIEEYKAHHKDVWPEIVKSIKDAGIENMEIYNVGNRLFMILEVNESFSFEKKGEMDAANPTVQKWESLMDRFQKRLPFADKGEKWVPMEKIFQL